MHCQTLQVTAAHGSDIRGVWLLLTFAQREHVSECSTQGQCGSLLACPGPSLVQQCEICPETNRTICPKVLGDI